VEVEHARMMPNVETPTLVEPVYNFRTLIHQGHLASLASYITKTILRSEAPKEPKMVKIANRSQLLGYVSRLLETFHYYPDHEILKMLYWLASSVALRAPRENLFRIKERANTVNHIIKNIKYDTTTIRRIADIGCGNGDIVMEIGRNLGVSRKNTIGLDTHISVKYPITYIQVDESQAYPVPDESIDLITVFVTLHHIQNPDHIESIKRMLKPGGLLIIREHDSEDDPLLHIYLDVIHAVSEIIGKGVTYEAFLQEYRARFLSRNELEKIFADFHQVFYSTYDCECNPQRLYHMAFIKPFT
jgi:ubiquinone/menaquinone biosynthesis C-methylase UbiE